MSMCGEESRWKRSTFKFELLDFLNEKGSIKINEAEQSHRNSISEVSQNVNLLDEQFRIHSFIIRKQNTVNGKVLGRNQINRYKYLK